MSFSVVEALREGTARFFSRTGALLVAIYVPAIVVYQLSINGLIDAFVTAYLPPDAAPQGVGVTYPAPSVVYAIVVLGLLLGMSAFTVVAVRTFVAGATDRIPREFYTRRLAWATANLMLGGLVFGLAVFVGSLLLVIPGIVAYVGLIFTTMFVAVDDENFVAALRHSWRLVRPEFLWVFVLVALLVVGMGALAFVLGIVLSFGTVLAGLGGWTGVVTGVLTAPMSLYLLAVLSAAFVQLRSDGPAGTRRTNADSPSASTN